MKYFKAYVYEYLEKQSYKTIQTLMSQYTKRTNNTNNDDYVM